MSLPPGYKPLGKTVVATPEALDLVAYLKALDRSVAALPAKAAPAPATAASAVAR